MAVKTDVDGAGVGVFDGVAEEVGDGEGVAAGVEADVEGIGGQVDVEVEALGASLFAVVLAGIFGFGDEVEDGDFAEGLAGFDAGELEQFLDHFGELVHAVAEAGDHGGGSFWVGGLVAEDVSHHLGSGDGGFEFVDLHNLGGVNTLYVFRKQQ